MTIDSMKFHRYFFEAVEWQRGSTDLPDYLFPDEEDAAKAVWLYYDMYYDRSEYQHLHDFPLCLLLDILHDCAMPDVNKDVELFSFDYERLCLDLHIEPNDAESHLPDGALDLWEPVGEKPTWLIYWDCVPSLLMCSKKPTVRRVGEALDSLRDTGEFRHEI